MKTITIKIKKLPEGYFLCTSPDVKGLVVQCDTKSIAKAMATTGKVVGQLLKFDK